MQAFKKLGKFLGRSDGGLTHKTLRAGIWVGLSSLIMNSLFLVRSVALARLLTPEIFGMWAICLMFVRALNVFTETGFAAALIQRQERFEETRDTAFTLLIVRGVALALVALAIAPWVADFYEQPALAPLLSVLALAFLLMGFNNVNTIRHQKELDFKRLVYIEQIAMIVGLIVVISIAYFYRSPWALVISHIVGAALSVVLSYVLIAGRPRLAFDKKIARELFYYGRFISAAGVIIFITSEIDNMFVGKLLGIEALGFYVLAYTLANLPATHFSKVISGIMLPAYSRLQTDLPALRNAYLKTLRFVSLLAIPAAFGIGALATEIIQVVYGAKWLPAVDALRVLVVYGCLRAIGSLSGYLYNAIGRPNITFYLNFAKLLGILILIYPMTKAYGLVGAAIAVTVPVVFEVFIGMILLRTTIGLHLIDIARPLLRYTLLSTAMTIVLMLIQQSMTNFDVISLLVLIGAGVLSYLILGFNDVRLLYRWISSRRSGSGTATDV